MKSNYHNRLSNDQNKLILQDSFDEITPNKVMLFDNQKLKEPLWDKRNIAQLLNISVKAIDRWVCQKSIPFIKVGSLVRFVPSEIEKWLQERSHHGN